MQFVPGNVTRREDLPSTQFQYIAFAPWITALCTKSYLAAGQDVAAFLFYIPDGTNSTPPLDNDEIWNLNDGGRWKSENKFPVYAIPGIEGAAIMQNMALYSGNTSDPTNLGIPARIGFDQTNYVRAYATLETGGSNDQPKYWVIVIVIVVAWLLIVLVASLVYCSRRRDRRDLQRRVANGEVVHESLGIRRTTVRQQGTDTLPTRTYVPGDSTAPSVADEQPEVSESSSSSPPRISASALSNHESTLYDQKSCTICFEDFIANTTIVCYLPCHHIYHPDCIDDWLATKDFCPVCQIPPLPSSEVYQIATPVTNAMVQDERRLRKIRQASEAARNPANPAIGGEGDSRGLITNIRRSFEWVRRLFSTPSATGTGASESIRMDDMVGNNG